MDRIFLIETRQGRLKDIRSYLTNSGSHCTVFTSVSDALKSREEPDAIVLLADVRNYRNDLLSLRISPDFSKVPRISVLPPEMTEVTSQGEGSDVEIVFRMPVDRASFLAKMASLKRRSLRRVFEILVNVREEGSNIKYTGKSLDFSRSGMAFESGGDFTIGQRIIVSFVNPRGRKRFMLAADVVRKHPKLASSSSVYGVKFRDISEGDVGNLMEFITGRNAP